MSGGDVERSAEDTKSTVSKSGSIQPSLNKNEDYGKPTVELIPLDLGGAAADVAAEGNYQHFSMMALMGIAYAILNSWCANTGSIYIGLGSGGPVGVLWGTVAATLGALANAVSLSELCHVWPTQGAHYCWTFALFRNSEATRFLSYTVGFFTTAGWIALTSSAPFLAAEFVTAAVTMYYPDWVPADWAMFVVYMFFVLLSTVQTIFGARMLDLYNRISLAWSILGAVIIFVVILACAGAHGTLRDGEWIFRTFTNQTGWPDGVTWILGLLQAQYSLVGADGAAHLVTEIPRPSINAPLAMVSSCVIGGVSSFILLIAVLAVITDANAVSEAGGGGLLIVFKQATQNKAGSVCLGVVTFGTLFFTLPALQSTTSRMIQSFANDNNLPGRRWLGKTDPRLEVPVWAILLNTFWLIVFGCLIFAPPAILPAIQGASVVILQISYIPAIFAMLFWGRRRMATLGVERIWNAGRFGATINVICLGYLLLTSVFFLFPSVVPVTSGSEMNYAVVVIAVVLLLSCANWFAWARTRFVGPSEFFSDSMRLQGLYPETYTKVQ